MSSGNIQEAESFVNLESTVPSLVDLCVLKAIDNISYLGDVGETDETLLERILSHCTMEQLAHIEASTKERDLSPITDKLWENLYKKCLVGYFIEKKLPYFLLKERATYAWEKYGLLNITSRNKDFFIFTFKHEVGCEEVLEEGPWVFAKQPLFLKKWERGQDFVKESFETFPIWCKLRNVPTIFWTNTGLSAISSGLGYPLYMDKTTADAMYLHYARVCIEMKLDGPFPKSLTCVMEDDEECKFEVFFEYAWIPKKANVTKKNSGQKNDKNERPRSYSGKGKSIIEDGIEEDEFEIDKRGKKNIKKKAQWKKKSEETNKEGKSFGVR